MSDSYLKKMSKKMRGNFEHFEYNNMNYNFDRFHLSRNTLNLDNSYKKYIENVRDDLNEAKIENEEEKIFNNILKNFKN